MCIPLYTQVGKVFLKCRNQNTFVHVHETDITVKKGQVAIKEEEHDTITNEAFWKQHCHQAANVTGKCCRRSSVATKPPTQPQSRTVPQRHHSNSVNK